MLKTEGRKSKAEEGRQGREITLMKDYSTRESVMTEAVYIFHYLKLNGTRLLANCWAN
jgi:hypothetical protein